MRDEISERLAKIKQEQNPIIGAKQKMRIKRFGISPIVLQNILISDDSFTVTKGIPKGAKFQGFTHDPATNNIFIFVEHESFDEVEDGHEVPMADPILLSRLIEKVPDEEKQ